MRDRFKYFDAMVTPVACFGAAHRKVYKQDLCRMDIVFRRLLRSIVGPPGDVDWTLPWHDILQHWNERARHGLKTCLLCAWDNIGNLLTVLPLCQEGDGLFEHWIGSQNMLATLLTLGTQ